MRRASIWTARKHWVRIAVGNWGGAKMATVIETGDSVSVGRVFSRGFGVIADNPGTVIGIAFLFGALPSVLLSWFQQRLIATKMDTYQVLGTVALSLASGLVNLVLQALVQ